MVDFKLNDEERAEVPRYVQEAIEVADELGIITTLEHFLRPSTMDRGSMTFSQDGAGDAAHAPCLNPWYYLVVHPDGKTSPCCVIPGIGDDVRDGLKDVWTGSRDGSFFGDLRSNMIDKKMTELCRNCTYSIISRNDYIREYLQ